MSMILPGHVAGKSIVIETITPITVEIANVGDIKFNVIKMQHGLALSGGVVFALDQKSQEKTRHHWDKDCIEKLADFRYQKNRQDPDLNKCVAVPDKNSTNLSVCL